MGTFGVRCPPCFGRQLSVCRSIFSGQHNLLGETFGGWEISGSAQFQTGNPCGVGTNNDYAGVGEYGSFGCGTEGEFWVQNGTPTHLGGFAGASGTGPKWFATTNGGTPIYTAPTDGDLQFAAWRSRQHLRARSAELEPRADQVVPGLSKRMRLSSALRPTTSSIIPTWLHLGRQGR